MDGFDQTGFELLPWREPIIDRNQGAFFTEASVQSDPPDGEPVFALPSEETECRDTFIQPDAPESVWQ